MSECTDVEVIINPSTNAAPTPGRRWEDSREALAAIDSVIESRGMNRREIIEALADNEVRNAIGNAVFLKKREAHKPEPMTAQEIMDRR